MHFSVLRSRCNVFAFGGTRRKEFAFSAWTERDDLRTALKESVRDQLTTDCSSDSNKVE
jgi:hypothetical protein